MSDAQERITIAISADLLPGATGGVFQATQALIRSLGQLEGPERYLLLAKTPEQVEWLAKCCGENQEIVVRGRRRSPHGKVRYHDVEPGTGAKDRAKAALRPSVAWVRAMLGRLVPQAPQLPMSDGFVESLQCDVLHFPTQGFTLSAVPTVFNPHDLQHLHYPQFWNAWELARRELVYRAGCVHAAAVVVGSRWAKDDVLTQYRIDPGKVHVVPEGAPAALAGKLSDVMVRSVLDRYALPVRYAVYPANLWPHKNHVRLVEAIALLRRSAGLDVPLVLTGSTQGGGWPRLQAAIAAARLEGLVHVLGFLPEDDLRAIQQHASCMVQPSLFEASSLPIFDAWMNGVPVAAADATALAEQVGDAGLLFDPRNVEGIAAAVATLWSDAAMREELRARGHRRIADFDWDRTARTYRAVYRKVARLSLGDEDRSWLSSNGVDAGARSPIPTQ